MKIDYHKLPEGMNFLWPTPVKVEKAPIGRCESVLTELLTTHDLTPPLNGVVGENIFRNSGPELTKFKNEIVIPAFERYFNEAYNDSISNYHDFELVGRLTTMGVNHSTPMHAHCDSQVVGVFYLLADTANGGDIGIVDPRGAAHRGYYGKMNDSFKARNHQPLTGDVVMFPSYVYHYVAVHSTSLRVALAVDLGLFMNR